MADGRWLMAIGDQRQQCLRPCRGPNAAAALGWGAAAGAAASATGRAGGGAPAPVEKKKAGNASLNRARNYLDRDTGRCPERRDRSDPMLVADQRRRGSRRRAVLARPD